MQRDLPRAYARPAGRIAGLADLGCDLGKPGFVAVGERKIGAARGQFDCKRPAYPARRPGHGDTGSGNRGHGINTPASEETGDELSDFAARGASIRAIDRSSNDVI
jgi:hypothetical protein